MTIESDNHMYIKFFVGYDDGFFYLNPGVYYHEESPDEIIIPKNTNCTVKNKVDDGYDPRCRFWYQ